MVSSAADRSAGPAEPGRFAAGPHRRAEDARLIVATSSVEVGVNLDTRLMLTDPGFGGASFLQRYGRCARGDVPGRVVVRLPTELWPAAPPAARALDGRA